MPQLTNAQQVARAYRVLVETAVKQKTITYGDLAARIGINNPQQAGRVLDPIQVHLRLIGLPPLTALAVSSTTGRPSDGLMTQGVAFQNLFYQVWNHTWDPALFDPLLR